MLKGIKTVSGVTRIESFFIRKSKVMTALTWLKKYHKWYREDPNLIIDETNLQWMNGADECELIGVSEILDDSPIEPSRHGSVSDMYDVTDEPVGEFVLQNWESPILRYSHSSIFCLLDQMHSGGTVFNNITGQSSEECKNACNDHQSNLVQFPNVSEQPKCEFSGR